MKVILRPAAQASISELFVYLRDIGYPDTASHFTAGIRDFILSLGQMPERIALCRFEQFAERGLRCASYKRWVIVFNVTETSVVVLNVIHSSRLI